MLVTLLSALLLIGQVTAQYSGHTGPITPLSSRKTLCNVLDYGGVADNSTDISAAITATYKNCVAVNTGSILYVPPGTYALKNSVQIKHGANWAFRLDGLIVAHATGDFDQNFIQFIDVSDFEFYSSNGKGAINGQGYLWRIANGIQGGPRMVRFTDSSDFSFHNVLLVDSPAFHLVVDNGLNVEIANVTIRAVGLGGSDGIDIYATNYHVHDVQVSNRDECVSVKNLSKNATIERIRCNQSGALSIGSLKSGTAVENILIQDIDVYESGAFVIKTKPSPAGSDAGYVKNVMVRRFRTWRSVYTVHIDQYWESSGLADGAGVQLSNITFSDFKGSNVDGYTRGYVVIEGSDYAPPRDIHFDKFFMFSERIYKGIGELNKCWNGYGTGECLGAGKAYTSGYESIITQTAAPTGWTAPANPTWALTTAYGTFTPIPVYTPVPTYPLDFKDYGLVAKPKTT
ncbi:hypothetical protein CI109_105893 [Kwoniella shandongensis]|uniref:Uncharacterized protein n=1 Tax=Kwoniella shandongensis TaxID=1734106 RepID=A0A5M6BT45_9TREE|nr:uncharacterized protein CI109_005670 [Kwoniella shandongensis]KAA5525923.1 hypothetical protein CI109_005670 [Kwoniella shandongensis]